MENMPKPQEYAYPQYTHFQRMQSNHTQFLNPQLIASMPFERLKQQRIRMESLYLIIQRYIRRVNQLETKNNMLEQKLMAKGDYKSICNQKTQENLTLSQSYNTIMLENQNLKNLHLQQDHLIQMLKAQIKAKEAFADKNQPKRLSTYEYNGSESTDLIKQKYSLLLKQFENVVKEKHLLEKANQIYESYNPKGYRSDLAYKGKSIAEIEAKALEDSEGQGLQTIEQYRQAIRNLKLKISKLQAQIRQQSQRIEELKYHRMEHQYLVQILKKKKQQKYVCNKRWRQHTLAYPTGNYCNPTPDDNSNCC